MDPRFTKAVFKSCARQRKTSRVANKGKILRLGKARQSALVGTLSIGNYKEISQLPKINIRALLCSA